MSASLKPLNQQIIVLTGASSGIGLCTAKLAAERGAKLVLVARSALTLQGFVAQIVDAGGEAIHVVADVGDRERMLFVARETIARFGRLNEVSEADNRRLFDTNFWGVVNGSLAALPHLKANGGALINVGSELS